jgi:peptidoglycan/LPS O-acetylase OafA/YrhL
VTGERRRIWPLVIAAGISLFVGFWGFVYQGYKEDAGFEPTQSWPIGVGGYLLAGVLALLAIRRARPMITNRQMVLVAIGVIAFLVVAAIGAVDGGRGWNA